MATQNVLIKILADVAGADASFKRMQATLKRLSDGTLTLGKNMRVFEQGTRGSVSAQQAAEKIARAYNAQMREQLQIARGNANAIRAITQMHQAEAQAIRAKTALAQAEAMTGNAAIVQKQQELKLRAIAIREIELETRALRANEAAKKANVGAGNALNNTLGNNANVTGSATFALTSLGQAFSDAGQFGMGMAQGIRAITNNVQQVAVGITFLTTQIKAQNLAMGTNITVFGALRAALTGPLGILFAIQATLAGIELITNLMQRSKKEAKEMASAFETAYEVVGNSLDSVVVSFDSVQSSVSRLNQELLENERAIAFMGTESSSFTSMLNARGLMRSALEEEIVQLGKRNERIKEALEPFRDEIKAYEDRARAIRILNEELTKEEKIASAFEAASKDRAAALRDEADAYLKRAESIEDGLPDEVDIGNLNRYGEEILSAIEKYEGALPELRENLRLLSGAEGLRLATLELQAKRIERQIELQRALNYLLAIGAPVDAMNRVTPVGTSEMGSDADVPDKLFMPGFLSSFIEDEEAYRDSIARLEDANIRARESFAAMGTELIVSFATIGGGFDMFSRTVGRFMQRLGSQMIQIGLTEMAFGKAMIAFKAALKANPVVAIAAGAALVAIGSRLSKQASNAANNPGQNDGLTAIDYTAPNFVNSGMSSFGGSVFGVLPASQLQPQMATGTAGRIEGVFMIRGNDLVATVSNEVRSQLRAGVSNPLIVQ